MIPISSSAEQQALADFFRICDVVPVTESICLQAAMIGRTITRTPIDLLIAATALELHLPVITQNTKDFKGITGLEVRMQL